VPGKKRVISSSLLCVWSTACGDMPVGIAQHAMFFGRSTPVGASRVAVFKIFKFISRMMSSRPVVFGAAPLVPPPCATEYELFVDGSCLGNSHAKLKECPTGWGVVVKQRGQTIARASNITFHSADCALFFGFDILCKL
jgi:hypothetical protein